MARPQCMNHEGVPAASMITMFETADTFSLCADCLQGWTSAVTAGMAGVDPERFQAVFLKLAAEAETDTPDPAIDRLLGVKAKRGGKRAEADAEAAEWDRHWAEQEAKRAAGEPPAPAPADTDQTAGDPTPAGAGEPVADAPAGTDAPADADGSGTAESPPSGQTAEAVSE